MNLSNAQVTGVAVAVLGFIFAGAYAVAHHHPDRTVQSTTPPSQPLHVQVLDRSVPDASVVFKSSTSAPVEQAATF